MMTNKHQMQNRKSNKTFVLGAILTFGLFSARGVCFTSCSTPAASIVFTVSSLFTSTCVTGHWEITLAGIAASLRTDPSVQFPWAALTRVADANIRVDVTETRFTKLIRNFPGPDTSIVFLFPKQGYYDPRHHFDHPPATTPTNPRTEDQQAFIAAQAYVMEQMNEIIQDLGAGKCDKAGDALDALGRALHAIQDVYSHSNYVDLRYAPAGEGLNSSEQVALNAAVLDANVTPPSSLKLTVYGFADNPENPIGGCDSSLATGTAVYCHQFWAKDSPGKNPISGSISNDYALYRAANQAAQDETSRFIAKIVSAVGKSTWNNVIGNYGTNNAFCQNPPPPCSQQRAACQPTTVSGQITTSNDPNDKNGSQGIGEKHYLSGLEPLRYSIYYDNTKDAAPAQDVVVNDPLDKGIDLNTVVLGPITFVNTIITPPSTPLATLKSFSKDIDLRPGQDLIARVTVSLDIGSGVLSWHFQSLDPQSGQPTDDPLAGFLPAGADGSVLFTAQSRAGLASNTDVPNTATVIFDGKPLPTPTWSNRLDNTPPKSSVVPLPASQGSTIFPVSWNGTDNESGLRDFTIYISDNRGAFSPWLTNTDSTQASYTGTPGHTYRFYSIARDLVGNTEANKTTAEATTFVSGAVPGDVNGDGIVDCADIAAVKSALGTKTGDPGFNTQADVNNDGVIDVRDLAFVSQHLAPGTKCQ